MLLKNYYSKLLNHSLYIQLRMLAVIEILIKLAHRPKYQNLFE